MGGGGGPTARRGAPVRGGGGAARPASLVLALVVLLQACGGAAPDGGQAAAGSPGAGERGELLVSAAASLTDVMAELEERFEAANPQVDVVLNLGGSSALRDQVLAGAPVDVLATANPATMDEVVAAGLVDGEPTVVATNRLAIAVPSGNPAGVEGLASLADPSLLVGLCAVGVPCGDLAREALDAAGVTAAVDTEEPDVRALLTKVAAGELDAGVVYATDVAAVAGAVGALPVPGSPVTAYPVAVVVDAPNRVAARSWVAFLTGDEAVAVLVDAGFGRP